MTINNSNFLGIPFVKRIFYAHSGGVTSVINATLVGLIREAHRNHIEVFIGLNGIHGLISRNYISSKSLSEEDLDKIQNTPGGSFGSCRYKPKDLDFQTIFQNIFLDQIDAIVYQGGNDSQLTLYTLTLYLQNQGNPCRTLGIPKTIDNDLKETDVCPGFGSAAFFLSLSMRQLCLDLRSMCLDSTKVYIMETMGRHTGWLTASLGLSHCERFPGPQIILIPEWPHETEKILQKISDFVKNDGYCAIAISEGYFVDSESLFPTQDAFGNKMLCGSALHLQRLVTKNLSYKTRISLPDYMQRSSAVLRSPRDFTQSYLLGVQAILRLSQEKSFNGLMLTLKKDLRNTQEWSIESVPLAVVAGYENPFPLSYVECDGWQLSSEGRAYMEWVIGPECMGQLAQFWPHALGNI